MDFYFLVMENQYWKRVVTRHFANALALNY